MDLCPNDLKQLIQQNIVMKFPKVYVFHSILLEKEGRKFVTPRPHVVPETPRCQRQILMSICYSGTTQINKAAEVIVGDDDVRQAIVTMGENQVLVKWPGPD